MSIQLSEQQRLAVLGGEPVLLRPEGFGQDVMVLRADAYRELVELLEDEREKAAWAKLGRQAARSWASENEF